MADEWPPAIVKILALSVNYTWGWGRGPWRQSPGRIKIQALSLNYTWGWGKSASRTSGKSKVPDPSQAIYLRMAHKGNLQVESRSQLSHWHFTWGWDRHAWRQPPGRIEVPALSQTLSCRTSSEIANRISSVTYSFTQFKNFSFQGEQLIHLTHIAADILTDRDGGLIPTTFAFIIDSFMWLVLHFIISKTKRKRNLTDFIRHSFAMSSDAFPPSGQASVSSSLPRKHNKIKHFVILVPVDITFIVSCGWGAVKYDTLIFGGHEGDEAFQDVRHQEEFGGKRPRGWCGNIYTWRPQGRRSFPRCPSPGRIWREKATWMAWKYL